MSVDFNTNMAPVAGVANPESTVEEFVRSFFPAFVGRDKAWICQACKQIRADSRKRVFDQVREIIPRGISVFEITKIMHVFKGMSLERDTITQAKRLIKEGMSGDEIILITERIHDLETSRREVVVTQALSIIRPEMKAKAIAIILSLLQRKQYSDELLIATELTLQLVKPKMQVAEVIAILETIIQIPSPRLVALARRLITDSTPGQEISEILKGIQKAPLENREAIVVQFQKLDTQGMQGEKKGEILLALGAVPYERLELIGARVANQLSSEKKISLLFMNARTEEFLPRLTAGLSDKDLPEMLQKMDDGLKNSAEIEKVCQHSLPFISNKMSVKSRVSILKWVATRLSGLLPLSPVPSDVRFRSSTNPFSPSLFLEDLPKDLRWRLTIDRKDQEDGGGPNCFDQWPHRSTGYRKAMEASLELIDHICGYRMNPQLLELLHDVSVDEASHTQGQMAKGYRGGWTYSYHNPEIAEGSREQLDLENRTERLIFTPDIENELRERYKDVSKEQLNDLIFKERSRYLAQSEAPDIVDYVRVKSLWTSNGEKVIARIFDQFYVEASTARTLDEKYAAVARCCRALSIFHAFPDGNGRTICFNLLTLLLHQIGSPPSIQKDSVYPFNGTKTVQEMVASIKEGVEHFQTKKIEVLIGEYAEQTPANRDASEYVHIYKFYKALDPFFSKA